MDSDIRELLSLKKVIGSTRSADEKTLGDLCIRAKSCISKRMEVLVASGLVDATTFGEIDGELEKFGCGNFDDSRNRILHYIDICLEKCKEHERLKSVAITPSAGDL